MKMNLIGSLNLDFIGTRKRTILSLSNVQENLIIVMSTKV